jgi:pimeloyl-ACP methyl ester carboxylesterase
MSPPHDSRISSKKSYIKISKTNFKTPNPKASNTMENPRKYGTAPFTVAVIPGGPGAPGEMAPVAQELSSGWGVLEPLQTAPSLDGQVNELQTLLHTTGDLPVTVIGWSWGAWLGFSLAARYPLLVKKLILIGSGPFEAKYAVNIMKTRLRRLSEAERAEVRSLMAALDDPAVADKDTTMARLGTLIATADAYNPLPQSSRELLECQYDIYHRVWAQASELRNSGQLLEFGTKIPCPVVAIHGDYDPIPPQGSTSLLLAFSKTFGSFC